MIHISVRVIIERYAGPWVSHDMRNRATLFFHLHPIILIFDFQPYVIYFSPIDIIRGDLQVCTAIQSHRHKAQDCGGQDSVEVGHGHNSKFVSVSCIISIPAPLFKHGRHFVASFLHTCCRWRKNRAPALRSSIGLLVSETGRKGRRELRSEQANSPGGIPGCKVAFWPLFPHSRRREGGGGYVNGGEAIRTECGNPPLRYSSCSRFSAPQRRLQRCCRSRQARRCRRPVPHRRHPSRRSRYRRGWHSR